MNATESLMFLCHVFAKNNESKVLRCAGLEEAQAISLENLIKRWETAPDEIQLGIIGEPKVLMTRWATLWIGIEVDGYAHS